MGDHKDCGAKLPVKHHKGLHQVPGRVGIQGTGRLISQYEPGTGSDCPCTGASMPLSAGYLAGELVQDIFYFQSGCSLQCDFGDLCSGKFFYCEGKRYIFPQGQSVQQVIILENESQMLSAELCHLVWVYLGEVCTVKYDPAGGGPVNGGDKVQQCGFSGAGGPHNPYKTSLRYRKTDIVHGQGFQAVGGVFFFYMV